MACALTISVKCRHCILSHTESDGNMGYSAKPVILLKERGFRYYNQPILVVVFQNKKTTLGVAILALAIHQHLFLFGPRSRTQIADPSFGGA